MDSDLLARVAPENVFWRNGSTGQRQWFGHQFEWGEEFGPAKSLPAGVDPSRIGFEAVYVTRAYVNMDGQRICTGEHLHFSTKLHAPWATSEEFHLEHMAVMREVYELVKSLGFETDPDLDHTNTKKPDWLLTFEQEHAHDVA